VLRTLDEPLWLSYLDAVQTAQEMFERHEPPVRFNRAGDRAYALGERLLAVPGLLERLRALMPTVRDPNEQELLRGVLDPPVGELWRSPQALLADPRVGLPAGSVQLVPAMYLSDTRPSGDEELLEQLLPENLSWPGPDLSWLGGPPLRVPGVDAPVEPFLLQVDLTAWASAGLDTDDAHLLASAPLPTSGVLQLFHSTTGDSRTDPDIPGGGATVLHLRLEQVQSGAYVDLTAADYPAHRISATALPTFVIAAEAAEDAIDAVMELQRRTDVLARGGTPTRDYVRAQRRNPFTAVEAPSTHVLGAPFYDFEVGPQEQETLDERLPLQDGDRHLLLFEVTAETVFDHVYGDLGRLQVWLRAADLAAAHFDDVVSFWHSG